MFFKQIQNVSICLERDFEITDYFQRFFRDKTSVASWVNV